MDPFGKVYKEGPLVKKGLAAFYKPWAARLFRFYADDVSLTYSTLDGTLRGRLKVEKCKAQIIIVPVSQNKPYTFQIMVRKFNGLAASSTLSPYPQG